MSEGKTVFVCNESSKREKCAGCDFACVLCSYIDNYRATFVVGTPIVNELSVIQYVGPDGKVYNPQVGVGTSGGKKLSTKEIEKIHDKVLSNARKYVSETCLLYKSH
jgi:hypothetical protein